MNVNLDQLLPLLYQKGINLGTKLAAVLLLWIVGRFIISWVKRAMDASLRARQVDGTLITYADNTVGVLLNIALVAALLGFLGVETTTFAGLLAGAGLAIGTAWSGLLSNFAAGAFLIVLKPFKKGDFVTAGGVTGTVREIGLFVTTIDTPDNVRTGVGNSKVFAETIQNFTANPYRRVDRTAQLAHGADHKRAIELLQARLAKVPNVLSSPPPDVILLDFTLAGPVLGVRPYTHNDNYWQVYFDTNEAIRQELGAAGFAVPETHHHVSR